MRIVLFGTGPFAVPSFEALIDSSHEVAALVTRPIANSGKRRKTAENPTRDLGVDRDLAILDPPNVNEQDVCLLYTSPSPRDQRGSRMPSSA